MLELMCRDKYTSLKYLFQKQKQTKVLQDSSVGTINM